MESQYFSVHHIKHHQAVSRPLGVLLFFALCFLSIGQLRANQPVPPPSWTVDPGAFQYNMTIIARVNYLGVPTNAADNIVGVFVGSELRGVATTVDVGGEMYFFITVYSNMASGENLSFKVYYQPNDAVYTSLQSLPFITNAQEGSFPTLPYWIFVDNVADLPPHFNTIPNDTTLVGIPFQTVNLANYLISDDGDPVVYTAFPGTNLSATINGAILTVSPISGIWTGTDTVRVVATEQTANMKSGSSTPKFTVNPFYTAPVLNAIPSQSINVGQTFSNYDLDNSLVFTGACRAFDYYVTPFSGSTANPGWATVAPGANPMTVIARPLFDKIQMAGAGAELAVFRGNTLVGKASPTGTAPNISYNFTLANLGTGNLTFKFYDASRQYLYTLATNLAFVPNGAAGSVGAPYLLQYCPLSPSIAASGVVSMGINDTNWFGTLPVNYMVWDCPFPDLAARRDTAAGSYTRFNNPNPAITSLSAINFQENNCLELYDAQSYDPSFSEGNGLTYAIVGGADQAKFSINATTGKLSWNNFVPNFEAPADANLDNKYLVFIRVTNTNNLTNQITLEVTITDNPVENFVPAINGGALVCLSGGVSLSTSGGGTYSWSTGQTTASISVTTSGMYSVTVTSPTQCTGVATVTVNPAPTVALTGSSATVCIGDQITLLSTPASGTAPYTFAWNGPNGFVSAMEDPTPFAASAAAGGNYPLTVTDNKGCTVTATQAVVFKSEAKPTLIATASTPVCIGAPITLTVSASGGTTPYSYGWSGPNTFSSAIQNPVPFNATVAAAGNYTVTVTSSGGCVATAARPVVVNAVPSIVANGATPVCQGSNVTLTSIPAGGTTPYTYLWAGPNNFASTIVNPIPFPGTASASGVYTVTVTDGNSCTATSSKNIVVSTTNIAPTVSVTGTSPVCVSANIVLNTIVSGGTSPFVYNWAGPLSFTSAAQNPAAFAASSGAAGTYTVTVTSADGCSTTATKQIQVNVRPTIAAAVNTPVCQGSLIQLASTPQGGGGSYVFAWQGPAGYTAISEDPAGFVAGLNSAGTYTVTVTDLNSCTNTATTTLIVSPSPVVTISTGPTCVNAALALNATSTGGTSPFATFAWSGPNGFISALEDPTPFLLSAMAEGTYIITVTDNATCTATASITVAGNSNPSISAANSGPTCQGSQLTLTSIPQGGTGAGTYSFLWTGPASSGYSATFQNPFPVTTSQFSNGVYTVKVTDANGCTGVGSTTALIKGVPTLIISNNGPLCFGTTALLTSNITGGSGNYTGYSWSGPLGYASTEANPVGFVVNSVNQGGNYNIVVTDGNGCTSSGSTSLSVSNNGAPTVSVSTNSPVCASSTLNLSAIISGGSGSYSGYSWAGPAGFNSIALNPAVPNVTIASAGAYTVTVTDISGCTATATASVAITGATISFVKTDIACAGGNTGSATVSTTGGVPPYTYSWSTGGSQPTITGLAAGIYTVTLTPQNASTCEQSATVQINQSSNLIVSLTSSSAACSGSTGSATVGATGGAPPYTYAWPASAGNQSTATATNLASGTYIATVTDNANCTGTASVTIIVGVGTNINSISNAGPVCPGKPVASIALSSNPSNAATVYTWTGGAIAGLPNGTSTGSGAIIPGFNASLAEGTYTVTVSASLNNCVSTTTFTITTEDNTPPVISNCPSNQTINNTAGLCTGILSWSVPTATDNCGSVTVSQNGGPALGSALAVGGTQTISYAASDNGGNNATCSFTVTVVDNEIPTINCPAVPLTVGTNFGNCSYTVAGAGFNAFASDNCGLKAGAAGLSFTATGAFTGSGSQLNTIVLPKGSTVFTWNATDVNNNTNTCVMTVNVVDDDAPVITVCPPNQIVLTSSDGLGDCSGTLPNLVSAAGVNDNCTSFANLVKTQDPVVGSMFSGKNGDSQVVVMTIADEAGNSTFCSALVTLKDDEKPIYVNCPDTITLNNDVDNCGANVFFTAPGATDNCSGQLVITQVGGPVPGTYMPVGQILTASFSAQDGAGNIALCNAAVRVKDAQSPKLVCAGGVQDFDASTNCNFIGTLPLNASATDNCALASVKNSVTNTNSVIGYVFPLGNTVVAWTATDIYGNTATCSYTVQITDQTAPVISVCPPSRVINTNSNGTNDCTGLVPDLLAELVVADNCSNGANLVKVQTPAANTSFGTAHNSVQVVQYTVTDEAGNTNVCTTSLTLNDNENPVVTDCPPNLTASTTDQYPCYATRTWTHPGATDNCSLGLYNFRILNPNNAVYGPVDIDPLNASYAFEVGTSVVSYQVADIKGNTATCSFSVVVTTVKSLVGDKIWHDQNGNGVLDAGEPGILGVSVTLQGAKTCDAAAVTQTTSSDLNGDFQFTNVEPGTYKVQFGTPAGFVPSTAGKGTDETLDSDFGPMGLSDAFVILIADTLKSVDAGFYQPTRIGNFVWDDTNGNGIQEFGEPGIPGVNVELAGTQGDGLVISATTTTDANGNYAFGSQTPGSTQLAPGTYRISFVLPAGGYVRTNANDPDATDLMDSDADLSTGFSDFEILVSGENNTNYDAGFYRPPSIGDYAWIDQNANGIQDVDEQPLQNVAVTLTGVDNQGNAVSATTLTDLNGKYGFTDLAPGSYFLNFAKPAGSLYELTIHNQGGNDTQDSDPEEAIGGKTATEILISGENNTTYDAGFYGPTTIGDYVWLDKNANGVQDPNETGLADIGAKLLDGANNPVTLDANGNTIVNQTTTNSGFYQFANLIPGTYKVQFINPNPVKYTLSLANAGTDDAQDSDPDAVNLITASTTIASNGSDNRLDAGFFVKARIGNLVWHDQNANGIQDGVEPGLSGVSVALTGTNGAGQAVTINTNTNANGLYEFLNVVPGVYKITFSSPGANFVPSTPDLGSDDTKDSDYGPMGITGLFEVLSSDTLLTFDAGFYQPTRIGNFVWDDTNGNGIQDLGEPGIPGVNVELAGTQGDGLVISATTTTDANGNYAFGSQTPGSTQLAPGSYRISFVMPVGGYVRTNANDADATDLTDSDADLGTGFSDFEILVSGENNTNYDAGYYRPPSIGDYVWEDINANGLQENNEPAIGNASVTLTGTDGQGNAVNQTLLTDIYGHYLFENLIPGTYKLTFPIPSGFNAVTYVNENADDTKDSDAFTGNNMTSNEVLVSGENNETYDAGFYRYARIGDKVWDDYNANGEQNPGEAGKTGVQLTLNGQTGNGTPLSGSATTGSDGSYIFGNLIPGTYTLTFTTPNGFLITQANTAGGNDNADSDIDPTGKAPINQLLSGEFDTSVDAGYYATDYGDLDNSYATQNGTSNGAYHILNPNLYLGTCVDGELNGGDDAQQGSPKYGTCPTGDDENGITFVTPLVQGIDACIQVTAFNTTGTTAVLQGWVDFNGDGDFLDAGELITLSNGGIIPVGGVTNALYCFPVPANATFLGGSANARFRLTHTGGYPSYGMAIGGEMEDYPVKVSRLGNLVWNDVNFNGTQDAGEPGMANVPVELTWAGPDNDLNTSGDNRVYETQTNLGGLYYFAGILQGTYRLKVIAPAMATPGNDGLSNEDTDSDGEITGGDLSVITQVFTIADPLNLPTGETGIGDVGVGAGFADAQSDETHDFAFGFLDYGDLPENGSAFNTTLAADAAVHATYPKLTLGACVDAERDGMPDDDAGIYDQLTTDTGDGDDGINTLSIDQQNCVGDPLGVVSAASFLCENKLILKRINTAGQVEFLIVNGDFSPQINAAGGFAAVLGSQVIISGTPVIGAYAGNANSLISCLAQQEGLAIELVKIAGTVSINFQCFDKNTTCNDDENGIVFETPLVPSFEACIRVTAQNAASTAAVLQGWIDWDGNGALDASEALQLSNSGAIPVGGVANAPYCFPVPATAKFNAGRVYARFRLSPNGGLQADGPATFSGAELPLGEVEDYILEVGMVGNRIWEDRNYDGIQDDPANEPGLNGVAVALTWAGPDGDLTTLADNRLYTQTTGVKNGNPGMYYFFGLINGKYMLKANGPADFIPTLINQGNNDQLDADDFVNGDVFTWPDVTNLITGEAGVHDLPGQIPNFPDKHDDQTHDMGFVAVDLGDNPNTYATLTAENGARATIVPGLYLGSGVDSESDGRPDQQSGNDPTGGDDNDPSAYNVGSVPANGDDEDGFNLLTPIIPGFEACASIQTTVPGAPYTPAYVSVWLDLNGNAAFDLNEKLTFTSIDGATVNTAAPQLPQGQATRRYCFQVPTDAVYNNGNAYFRIRLNTTANIPPTGTVPFGEVEDYWKPVARSGNFVWMDSDIEGDQDVSEMPLAGVTMVLRWAGEDQNFNTADDRTYGNLTDANGRYGWLGLISGPYRITPLKYLGGSNPVNGIAPLGKILTIPNLAPANDFNDSDAAPFMALAVPDMLTNFLVTGEDGLYDNNGQLSFPDNQEDNSLDAGFIDEPKIASALQISGIEKASSGNCGQFDVIMTLCIQNSGKVPVNNLQASLDLGGANAFGSMFLGFVPNGAPAISSSDAQQNPGLAANYDGNTNFALFNGTSGLLWPNQKVCVRMRFELKPTVPGAPNAPDVQALIKGFAVNFQNVPIPDFINGGQFMVNDLSDDGDNPLTANPFAPGDNGTADDPTPLTDCWKIAAPLVANDVVHVSMDSTCLALIEASMVLEGEADACTNYNYPLGGYYKVTLRNENTNQIIPNPLTAANLGQTIVVEIEHQVSCNKTWGKLILEDKLAPKLTCPPNITIACSQPLAPSTTGNVSIQDCSPTTTQIAESVQDNGECGTPRLQMERTFIVTDSWTNQTTCSHLITVLPFNLPEIVMPADVTVDCETAYLNPNATAPVVTGQPSINGSPVGASLCSATLGYTDVVTYGCAGNYDIFRTWVVSNSCLPTGPGNPIEYLQRIRVKDFGGPVFSCPGNVTVSTDPFTCCATAPLPDVVISEGCSQIINLEARVTGVDPSSGNITTFTIPGTYSDFPGNNYWKPDTLAVFAFTQCLPEGNTYTVKYSASDNCANLSSCEFLLTVEDLVPPVSACDAFTQVALGNDGIAVIDAATFNDGSKDYCHPVTFRVRPMLSSACQSNDQFEPTISFCCDDIGDSVLVQFRVYDVPVLSDSVGLDDYEGHFNDCMVTVFVEDKIKPTCNAPANVTVSCENFDPSLTAYGLPEILDNCCLDSTKVFQGQIGLSQTLNLSLFDSLCNKGTITRTFRAFDCGGNSSQCTQRIVVNYEQDYYVKFPNDVIVTSCDGTGDFGKPTFVGKDCEALGITFEDQIFTVVPDACFEIQRTWKIINWCTYNANLPYTIVPNPNPNSNSTSSQNLPGPVVSPAGTPAPWAPTVVKLLPTDPTSTDFSSFWTANVNGYQYVQIIKVQDGQDPAISNCPDSTVVFADQTVNEKYHWNETYWWDNALGIHDLCEGPTDLSITAIDSCSGADLKISYLLFLDLDNDNVQETVISSDQTGLGGLGWNKVPFGNATNPNYSGGILRAFDQRPGAPNFKYGFALETLVVGNTRVGRVRWNTQANQNTYVVPELPYGKHRILWVVEDGCGNEKTCEYSFEVKDGKAPTVVCLNGLSTNLSGVGISQTLWASDFLQYTEDNCTPVAQLVTGIRKKGTGTAFPYNPDGTPQTSVSYSCTELGTQIVELWSIDKAGNAGYCETYIIIQDNDGVCPSDSNSAKVAGFLLTEAANGLEEGSVEITGTGNAIPSFTYSSLTGASGKYLFNAVPLSSNSTVTPLKDDNHLNGVSTYDLVLISRHILGIDTLDSPYKMIAADANKSESITNFDIVELRRLILGITLELGSNTSWRFVDKAFVFPDPLQPFLTNFPEFKPILSLSGNRLEEDFVAIKVGDVNTNAIANALMSSDDRSNGTLLFDLEDRQIAAGETFTVALKASEVTTAYQFTLQFPGLEVVDILPGAGMRAENFGVFANAITTSYDGPLAGEFAIRFRALKAGKLSALLSVSSRITKAEAYQNGALLDVALRFNQGAQQTIAGVGFELYQNQPNPFVHKTMIPFNLPEASNAVLSIYDETGRLVYSQKGNFAKGYNTVAVDLGAINTGGLLYYKLETERDAATQKMVQMK